MQTMHATAWFAALALTFAGCSALVNPDEGRLGGGDGDSGVITEDGGSDGASPDASGEDASTDGAVVDGAADGSLPCPGDCDDGIPCTVNACVDGSCISTPSNALCAAGELCDVTLGCVRGTCRGDGDCDDSLYCNGAEHCTPGAPGADDVGCTAGEPVVCDDGAACSTSVCDEAADACAVTLDHAACDDGVDCSADGCAPGAGDADARGCVNRADDSACDTDFCVVGRRCSLAAGRCTAGTARDCLDGDACTSDVCDSASSSCINAPRDDDGDGYPTASAGPAMCGGGTDCDDGNSAVNPGATEVCNRVDDDCDGVIDEACDSPADTCAQAQAIPARVGGGTVTVRGTFTDFGSDYQSPCGRASGRDAVYYVDVAANVDLYIDTFGSSADTVLAVATSCDLTGFAELGCNDDTAAGVTTSRVWVHRFGPTAAGTTRRIYILVDGYERSTTGSFQLNVRAQFAAGDSCGSTIDISGGGSLVGFISTSILPSVGPTGTCQPSGSGTESQGIARFDGPADGDANFTVFSSDFDPDIYVRAAPCATGTETACVAGDGVGISGFLYSTDLVTRSRPGQRYYVFADGAAGGDAYWLRFEP